MEDNKQPKKSYKREVAFLLFVWLVYLVETKEPELVQILTFPIFTFGALAFGLQWYAPNGGVLRQSSQLADGRWSHRSSQRPSWQDEYTDDRDYYRYRAEASETSSEEDTTDSRHKQSKSRIG